MSNLFIAIYFVILYYPFSPIGSYSINRFAFGI